MQLLETLYQTFSLLSGKLPNAGNRSMSKRCQNKAMFYLSQAIGHKTGVENTLGSGFTLLSSCGMLPEFDELLNSHNFDTYFLYILLKNYGK